MLPLSAGPLRSTDPAAHEDDTDATASYSESDDEQPDPPVLQRLAAALIAWEPTLLPAYARLGHAPAELAAFASFLARLDRDVGRREAMRGEIVGWLQSLVADEAARSRALRLAGAAGDAGPALATYRAIRAADQ